MSVTITITGTGFTEDSVAKCDGTTLDTTFVDDVTLTAIIPHSIMAVVGAKSITVVNPTPGGGTSAASTFTVTAVAVDIRITEAGDHRITEAGDTRILE
jgi:hypothetical protein